MRECAAIVRPWRCLAAAGALTHRVVSVNGAAEPPLPPLASADHRLLLAVWRPSEIYAAISKPWVHPRRLRSERRGPAIVLSRGSTCRRGARPTHRWGRGRAARTVRECSPSPNIGGRG